MIDSRRRGLFFTIILAFAAVAVQAGSPFTKPAGNRKGKQNTTIQVVEKRDTLCSPPNDSIVITGFEKTLRSARESMYVSNRTSQTITGLALDISYYDISDRMLHKSAQEIDVEVPAGETRLIDIQSFDRQGLYYYYLSPLPKRASRATPFKVGIEIKYITR